MYLNKEGFFFNVFVANLWQLWSGSKFKQQQAIGHYNDLLRYYEGQPSVATREIDKVCFWREKK